MTIRKFTDSREKLPLTIWQAKREGDRMWRRCQFLASGKIAIVIDGQIVDVTDDVIREVQRAGTN